MGFMILNYAFIAALRLGVALIIYAKPDDWFFKVICKCASICLIH
jgi:uncharacterized membrane protein YczE